jgi:hypothetical protein
MIHGVDLGEVLGLGGAGRVATRAEHGGIRFHRRDRSGIGGVIGKRAVAGLAIHMRVLAFRFNVHRCREFWMGRRLRGHQAGSGGGGEALLAAQGIRPGLAAVLVGHVPASEIYVRSKVQTCAELGNSTAS